MPVVTLYRHGFTAGCAPSSPPPPPERTQCAGWTTGAIRRNKLFLYSVDERALSGAGFALSLTVKTCPPTHEDWRRLLEAFFERLRYLGRIRAHWIVEWQRRGFPHLHMAVWFPEQLVSEWVDGGFARLLVSHWIQVAGDRYGSMPGAQHVTPIYDALGWNQYTSKHASRGLSNYQRNPASIPKGWREHGTGRMWGKLGDWDGVCQDKARVEMPFEAYHQLRRITRGYNKAKAQTALAKARRMLSIARNAEQSDAAALQIRQALRRVTWTRRMLSCTEPKLSGVRGLNEWMPQAVQLQALAHLSALGFEITS